MFRGLQRPHGWSASRPVRTRSIAERPLWPVTVLFPVLFPVWLAGWFPAWLPWLLSTWFPVRSPVFFTHGTTWPFHGTAANAGAPAWIEPLGSLEFYILAGSFLFLCYGKEILWLYVVDDSRIKQFAHEWKAVADGNFGCPPEFYEVGKRHRDAVLASATRTASAVHVHRWLLGEVEADHMGNIG